MVDDTLLMTLVNKIASLESRLSVLVQRGVVIDTQDPEGANQLLDVMTGVDEVATSIERIQEYGLSLIHI